MSVTKVTNDCIVDMAASKLTGSMPAIDGSNLTGISAYTQNANDPAIDTNPSGGLGTVWVNTTSGEVFSCTDATTDANVWFNTGGGDGDVQPFIYQGSISGYRTAGYFDTTTIDKFSMVTDGNATNIGDLTLARHAPAGVSSKTHGFTCGGARANTTPTETVDKHSFTTDGDAVDHCDLSVNRSYITEPGSSSTTHGYNAGGYQSGASDLNIIDKFNFSSTSTATDVGDLTSSWHAGYGFTSDTHGYSAWRTQLDKYSHASDGNATSVGQLSTTGLQTRAGSGKSSTTHGYASGGEPAGGEHGNVIDKFSFASEGTATDVGDLTVGRGNQSGASSTTHGYTCGGDTPNSNVIDKFSFTTDGNATDVGDMTNSIGYSAGQHY